MKKTAKIFSLATMLLAAATGTALATPSTQIWIPSTDIQPYKTVHLGIDNYIRTSKNGPATNMYDGGITVGVLPFEKLQLEVGADYMETGTSSAADSSPFYFNAKLGTPEGSLFNGSPALAAGGYNFGTKLGITTQNISYVLAAKTLPAFGAVPSLGRVSAGYYHGSGKVLVDRDGKAANDGLLVSWDRTMSEISDRLWMAVDYQSGNSSMGALSFGVSWAFSKNVSLLVGYDIYNDSVTGGKNTITTQLDINIP